MHVNPHICISSALFNFSSRVSWQRGVRLVYETESGLLRAHRIIGPPFVDLKSLSTVCHLNVWGCHGKQEGRGRQGRVQAVAALFPVKPWT